MSKPEIRAATYAEKCMKYLTFLDFTTLETTGKNIESKLSEKIREIHALKEKYDVDIALLKEAMLDMQQLLKNRINWLKYPMPLNWKLLDSNSKIFLGTNEQFF
ncbi:MAG: hypothetical protein WAZ77_07170 [Candidatus Nitrosopolaris sp.]